MDLLALFTILIAATLVSFALAVPIISLLYKLNITRKLDVDFSAVIDNRKSKAGTPVMGGLIIVVSFLILNIIFNLNGSTFVPLTVVLISALLGGLDDVLNIYGRERRVNTLSKVNTLIKVHANKLTRVKLVLTYPWHAYKAFFFMLGSNPGKGIQAHEKVIINALAGVAVYWWIYYLTGWADPNVLFFPFGLSLDIGLLMFPFVILTVLTMTNSVNIADGMDGLAAGMLIPAFAAFFVIAVIENNPSSAIMTATAMGGTTAYLYFNIPPARVQMGDVGSLSLGTLLAVIALELRLPFLLAIICLPFLLEFSSSMLQGIARRITGRRVFMMAPLHHHFELLGWKEEKVVMRFWLFSIFSAILGIWVYLLY